jgi:hypothetical protein
MKKIVLSLFLLMVVTGFSQKNQIQVLCKERIVGKSLIDSSDIKGFEYAFPDRIHETFLDTTTGFLSVQLRGLSKNGKWLNNSGNMVQYDLKTKRVLWSKMMAYQMSTVQQFSNTMIYTVGNKSSCLNVNTGNELWEVKNNLYLVDPNKKIGIGYKFKGSTGYSNDLEGLDLTNGDVIWNRELNREYGWNDVFYTNDSTIIVVAAGLHAINLKTGMGWDYHTITGKKDYTEATALNAVGLAAGLLTGNFVMSTGHNLVRDLVSNSIINPTSIYFASREQLVKLNKQSGEIEWCAKFPSGLASKSTIFMNDSILFMVNKGMAFMGNRQLHFGKPFLAAFNKRTGEKVFFSLINAKEDPILNFQELDKEIFLVFKNRVQKYSLETGTMIAEKEFPKEEFGELKYFVGDQVYVKTQGGDLANLTQSDSTKLFLFTNQGKTLSIDRDLNITKTILYQDLCLYYWRTKDYKLFAKDRKTLIVNNAGKTIAEIEATSNAFVIGKTLYDTQGSTFVTMELGDLMTN